LFKREVSSVGQLVHLGPAGPPPAAGGLPTSDQAAFVICWLGLRGS
jgi:hypothetical protein